MRNLTLILLFASTCLAAEPKFHFQDCIKVLDGFYKGCSGRVVAINQNKNVQGKDLYDVNLTCKNNETTFQTVLETQIAPSPRGCDAP